jgi:hypothetical protein
MEALAAAVSEWKTNPKNRVHIAAKYLVGERVAISTPCGDMKGFTIVAVGVRYFCGYDFKYKVRKGDSEFEVDEIEIEKE